MRPALLALLVATAGCKGGTTPPGLLMPQTDLTPELVANGRMPDLDGGVVTVYELDFSDGDPPGRLKAKWWTVRNPSDAGIVQSVELELLSPAVNQVFTAVRAQSESNGGATLSYMRLSGVDRVSDGKGGWSYPNSSSFKDPEVEGRSLELFPDGTYRRNIEPGAAKPTYVNGSAKAVP